MDDECEDCGGGGDCQSCDGTGLEDGKVGADPCQDCEGTGTCPECHGSGMS